MIDFNFVFNNLFLYKLLQNILIKLINSLIFFFFTSVNKILVHVINCTIYYSIIC